MAITHCPHCDEYVSDRITVCPKCKKDMLVPHVDENGVERTLKRESLDFPPLLQKCVDYYDKQQEANPFVVTLNAISKFLTLIFIIPLVLCAFALVAYGFAPILPLGIFSMVVLLIMLAGITVFHALASCKSPVIFVDKMQDWMLCEKIDPYEVLDAIMLLSGNKMEEGLSKQTYNYALTAIAQAALSMIKKGDLDETPNLYKKKKLADLFNNLSTGFLCFLLPLAGPVVILIVTFFDSLTEGFAFFPSISEIFDLFMAPYTAMPCFFVFAVIGIVLFIVTKILFRKKKIAEQEAYRLLTLSKWMKEDYKKLRTVHFETLNADSSAQTTK